jgi:5-methylcytosine-specific restriction endonuclease McrA
MAGRPAGPKTRCGGKWTEARYHEFIANTLRGASRKWGPIAEALKNARVKRGFYTCASCKEIVPYKVRVNGKLKKNIHVDHIVPIVNPETGFISWDDYIERMFCEIDNLQILCTDCHKLKCDEERAIHTERRRKERGLDD